MARDNISPPHTHTRTNLHYLLFSFVDQQRPRTQPALPDIVRISAEIFTQPTFSTIRLTTPYHQRMNHRIDHADDYELHHQNGGTWSFEKRVGRNTGGEDAMLRYHDTWHSALQAASQTTTVLKLGDTCGGYLLGLGSCLFGDADWLYVLAWSYSRYQANLNIKKQPPTDDSPCYTSGSPNCALLLLPHSSHLEIQPRRPVLAAASTRAGQGLEKWPRSKFQPVKQLSTSARYTSTLWPPELAGSQRQSTQQIDIKGREEPGC